jgi:hypothetical protein
MTNFNCRNILLLSSDLCVEVSVLYSFIHGLEISIGIVFISPVFLFAAIWQTEETGHWGELN